MRRQDAMKSKHVKSRRRNEGAELLDPLERIKQEMRGAVPSGASELVEELALRALHHPLHCQRRTQEVATDVLESLAGVSGEGDIGMTREPLEPSAPRFVLVHLLPGNGSTASRG